MFYKLFQWFICGGIYPWILFATASRPGLGPTQPPMKWIPVALSSVVKRPER